MYAVYCLIPYLLVLATCVVPIVFLQSFLGQFSSTGFISVFRISPLFKGIGYVSLAINLTTLTYYSIFGAIPLFFLFHSLRLTIPWSCDGAKKWMKHPEDTLTPCLDPEMHAALMANNISREIKIPSYEFFKNHIQPMDLHTRGHPDYTFSWSLLICTLIIWMIVRKIVTKPMETVSRFIRYSCLTVIGILCLLCLRLAFLPGAFEAIRELFNPPGLNIHYIDVWGTIPFMALAALGPGWGSILTMASFNNFKTNIFNYSWLMCLAQFGIIFGLAIQGLFASSHYLRPDPKMIYHQYMHSQWMEFLLTPSALTFIEFPHFWTILFFGMMILGTLNLMIVQFLSILTSIFDEYEKLRNVKNEVILVMAACFTVVSISFCSNYGITFAELLAKFSAISQMVLNLFLLLVVLWIYGRERFQRDVNFMTGRTYPTWMVNIVRFVAPLFLLLSWAAGLVISLSLGYKTALLVTSICCIVLLPWLFVPGYCIFKLLQTSGMLNVRFKRSIRPTDWYPVDSMYRNQYEETFSRSEISHQLTTTATGTTAE
ncbi:sodium-dependent proline transporter-like isoform X2 [Eupeodes corollae]|uniref:sodium-dependent proline transporter-like isoform X2 n=1 Tax=Eupeodes corollae TaxID=290404 RepID=UPI0024901C95|nr:sodium-dependent proline transporter-like isoform X2 [Eupeodes corollae]